MLQGFKEFHGRGGYRTMEVMVTDHVILDRSVTECPVRARLLSHEAQLTFARAGQYAFRSSKPGNS